MDINREVESIAVRDGQTTNAWYKGAVKLDNRIDVSDALHNAGFNFHYVADDLFYNTAYPEPVGYR